MAVSYQCHLSISSIITISLLIFAVSVSSTRTSTHQQHGEGVKAEAEDSRLFSVIFKPVVMARRRLNGLGSWPPSCRSKCGKCSPCYPVHIAVHPGFTIPLQYYPEAWRCKCGNNLYMP